MRFAKVLSAALLLSCAACTSTYSVHRYEHGTTLLEEQGEDGSKISYRLLPAEEGSPRIDRIVTTASDRSRLGVIASTINSSKAEALGVTAWKGVYVERVVARSAAASSGLSRGDIILAIGGVEISNREQFGEVIDTQTRPGEEVTLEVLRGAGSEETESYTRIAIVPDAEKVTETKTDSYPLESSRGVERLTGLQVAEIPSDLTREVFRTEEPITVVSGVVTGSPAYRAGLRCGDRIIECDGAPVTSLRDIRTAVFARSRHMNPSPGVYDLVTPIGEDTVEIEPRESRIALRVIGPLGSHEARLAVVNDVHESSSFKIPIIYSYDSSVDNTRWSFLHFIFQLGASYRGRQLPSESRQPAKSSRLSLLPFGMFEFENSPTYDRTTLFWFITFGSRK